VVAGTGQIQERLLVQTSTCQSIPEAGRGLLGQQAPHHGHGVQPQHLCHLPVGDDAFTARVSCCPWTGPARGSLAARSARGSIGSSEDERVENRFGRVHSARSGWVGGAWRTQDIDRPRLLFAIVNSLDNTGSLAERWALPLSRSHHD
jgi:hypothetical protein